MGTVDLLYLWYEVRSEELELLEEDGGSLEVYAPALLDEVLEHLDPEGPGLVRGGGAGEELAEARPRLAARSAEELEERLVDRAEVTRGKHVVVHAAWNKRSTVKGQRSNRG